MHTEKVAAILPCFKSKRNVGRVIAEIGPEVDLIVVVDDACPVATGRFVESNCLDPRVLVVYNEINLGVGGAVIRGYREALARGADILVKIDSDGQMDPKLIPLLVHPLRAGFADYAKGNRFFDMDHLRGMPFIRVLGNAALSFLTKLSSGYWNIFDPTNGYTAVHRSVLETIALDKIDQRFFFESDMLFRLYLSGAVVQDVPLQAKYSDEESNLRIGAIIAPFLGKNMRNAFKRILYRYFLRDMNIGSLELLVGILLFFFGLTFGFAEWAKSATYGMVATPGTVMLAGLPVLAGLQMILGFFAYDVAAVPSTPVQKLNSASARRPDSNHTRPPDLPAPKDARITERGEAPAERCPPSERPQIQTGPSHGRCS